MYKSSEEIKNDFLQKNKGKEYSAFDYIEFCENLILDRDKNADKLPVRTSLIQTLARAYLSIEQKWKDSKTPAAWGNHLGTKKEILTDLGSEIKYIKNNQIGC